MEDLRDIFDSFEEALSYYRTESSTRYVNTDAISESERTATLSDNDDEGYTQHVAIWPIKGDPIRVYAEEF